MSGGRAELPEFLLPAPVAVAPQAPRPERPTSGHVPGETGVWVFVLGDLTLFGAFFVGYLAGRSGDPAGFAAAGSALHQAMGTLNTVVLLTSSLAVVLALQPGRAPRHGARLLTGALVLAGVFAVVKAVEYASLIGAGVTPDSAPFFIYYFVLTGVHLLHLLIGAVLLAVLLRQVRRGTPARRFAEGVATYWHMVDLLWIALFALLYLVPVT